MKTENSGLQQDGSENDLDAAILLMDVMMDTTKDGTCEDKDSRSNPAASLVKGDMRIAEKNYLCSLQ